MKKYRLPKEFTDKWLKALRSGEYKQCAGGLYRDGGYCCLGVSLNMQGVKNSEMEDSCWLVSKHYGFRKKRSKYVPEELYGHNTNPLVKQLVDLNDLRESFTEIADWIEQNVETY